MAGETMTPDAVLERLHDAMNRHDIAAFASCFHEDYTSEQPVHPDRHFVGKRQVEMNWGRMFAGVPDFRADLLRHAVSDDTVWAEWRWTGRHNDGGRLDVRGVTILGVKEGRFAWARLYVEDVDETGRGIDEAVGQMSRAP